MKNVLRIGFGLLLASGGAAVAQQYIISTAAGGAQPTLATGVIGGPLGIASDAAGNVYFSSNAVILKLDTKGVLTRVAGNFQNGYSGDEGPATNAKLNDPRGLAVDSAGALYIADAHNGRIRKVSPSGIITTVAGGGYSYLGDGGPATNAQLFFPSGVAVDAAGSLYIADAGSYRVRKVSQGGIITTVAGRGASPVGLLQLGDGGPAANAYLLLPSGVAVDPAGALYIADYGRIRRVSPSGVITTIATVAFEAGVTVDAAGSILVADSYNSRILKIRPDGVVSTIAGSGISADDRLTQPAGVAADAVGNLFIADTGNHRVRKMSRSGALSTVAGNGIPGYNGDGGEAVRAQFDGVIGVALDGAGNLFIADTLANRIRKVLPNGSIATIAGDGVTGYNGDGRDAADSSLNQPQSVAVDAKGNLYIADTNNFRIRQVSPSGVITTLAQVSYGPIGVAIGPAGDLYFSWNNRVSRLLSGGNIEVVAGNGVLTYGGCYPGDFFPRTYCVLAPPLSGDGGRATDTPLYFTSGMALDAGGNLFIADAGQRSVRKVSPGGIITTVAGNGVFGYSGDGGPATTAQLRYPTGVALDTSGSLYIADSQDHRIRKVSPDGVITTIAGNGLPGHSGDGGLATHAQLSGPTGIAVDAAGNIYVADTDSVRLLQPSESAMRAPAVTNAASNLSGPIAPGEIVSLSGSGFGPAEFTRFPSDGAGVVGKQLAGTSVTFNGIPGPVLETAATRVSAVVPYGISGPFVRILVAYQGVSSAPAVLPAAPSEPGLFTADLSGKGQAKAINQDGSRNDPENPAPLGSVVSFYATGEGQTFPGGVDGRPASQILPRPVLPVSVMIGGQPATLRYAGAAPDGVGVMQIDVQIPAGIPADSAAPVVLQVGGASSQPGVTLAVSEN